VGHLDELACREQRLGDRTAHVLLVVRLAGGHDELQLVGMGAERELGTFGVRHEGGVDDARSPRDPGHHLVGTGHRRDRLGPYERSGLDAPQARSRQRVDQPDPIRDRDGGLVLQSVARPDLTDLDRRPRLHAVQM
jgi:hypothetical protein